MHDLRRQKSEFFASEADAEKKHDGSAEPGLETAAFLE